MRRGSSRRVAILAAFAALVVAAGVTTGARADHGANGAWLSQAGNGHGGSGPVFERFSMLTVVFDNGRFGGKPGNTKYMAYGWGSDELGNSALKVSKSDDGLTWGAPQTVLLQEPGGTVPITVGPSVALDVVSNPASSDRPIELFYKRGVLPGTAEDVATIHRAFSQDGRTFYDGHALKQKASAPAVVDPAASTSWNYRTQGPSDVIRQAGSPGNCDHTASTFPWNCRYVMAYDANDGDFQYVGLAGSPDGDTWAGRTAPALCPDAGPATGCPASIAGTQFDENSATFAKIFKNGSTYVLYYSGAEEDFCFLGGGGCFEIGIATSTNGTTFTRTSTSPAIPSALVERFTTRQFDATQLLNPSIVEDGAYNGSNGHHRVYYNFVTGVNGPPQDFGADLWMAYTSPAPGAGPSIRISSPLGGLRNVSATPIEFYVTDTLGAPAGVDLNTLSITIDGQPIAGGTIITESIVTAMLHPAFKITVDGNLNVLPDGTHTFGVSVKDVEGNPASATTVFTLDTTAPVTQLTQAPASPLLVLPGDSIGNFKGTSVEGTATTGTAMHEVRVTVVNPLGQSKTFSSRNNQGWIVTKTDAKHWGWTWLAPNADPHFAVPGTYSLRFSSVDVAGNAEKPTPNNSVSLLVL